MAKVNVPMENEMANDQALAALRPRLFRLAYRMLGLRQEAEDAVQEAFLRWHARQPEDVRSMEAWLVTVLSRLCVDRLRALQTEREAYIGPWLPEPLVAIEPPADQATEQASELSMALLLVLQRLSAEERVGFLMRDVFDCAYADIATALGKSEAACRQLVHRARGRVSRDKPRFEVSEAAHQRLVQQYIQAVQERDAERIAELLTPEAVYLSDGGGKVGASRRPITGARRIARLEIGVLGKLPPNFSIEVGRVNGRTGAIARIDGRIFAVSSFETDGTRILSVMRVLNPEKLTGADTNLSARPASASVIPAAARH